MEVGSTCGGDLDAPSLKWGRLAHVATTTTLLFLQYYYKYITIPHIAKDKRWIERKKNHGSHIRCNASELV